MHRAAISGTGIYVPPHTISNEELVASFNDYAMAWNRQHEARIAAGELAGAAGSRASSSSRRPRASSTAT